MKKIILFFFTFGNLSILIAQKLVIDSSVFNTWPSVSPGLYFNDDGNYLAYTVNNMAYYRPTLDHYIPSYRTSLIIQSNFNNWKKTFDGVNFGVFNKRGNEFIFKTEGDSLCVLALGGEISSVIPHVKYFQYSNSLLGEYLFYILDSAGQHFVIHDLVSGNEKWVEGVIEYSFSPDKKTLLVQMEEKKDSIATYSLLWVNLENGSEKVIWNSKNIVGKYVFSTDSDQLAFFVKTKSNLDYGIEMWHYKSGNEKAILLVDESSKGIDSNLKLSNESIQFSMDGSRVFVKLIEKAIPQPAPDAVKVDVWGYKDSKLQSLQLTEMGLRSFRAVVSISEKRMIRLQQDDEFMPENGSNDDFQIVFHSKGYSEESWWNPIARPTIYLVSTLDGSRKVLNQKLSDFVWINYNFPSSPNGRYIVYFDQDRKAYFSYDVTKGTAQNISKNIPVSLMKVNGTGGSYTAPTAGLIEPESYVIGVGDWMDQGSSILIYDDYDIWKVDPAGVKSPLNLTNGYGKAHKIQFRLAEENSLEGSEVVENHKIFSHGKLLFRAFDTKTKYSGFYQKSLEETGDPEYLTMGPWNYSSVLMKAGTANIWGVSRMSDKEPSNLFTTKDFKTFTPVSDVQPQKRYNWLTAELFHWKTSDGTSYEGILYKPENFDSTKKYPVLFNYYEKRSDQLFDFKQPGATWSDINIPYFVSNGYLVFVPDMQYKIGFLGESILKTVVSAVTQLSKLPYVDAHRMGINGQSFGGYETNYLVTHTHIFAAAAEMAGPTDLVSSYGSVRLGGGRGLGTASDQMLSEIHQTRIGATLWMRPDLYIQNSPVFRADQMTTPLLMVHCLGDDNVPFEQALEFYTGLRRLGKKVWLLQYDHDGHALTNDEDALDHTIRLTQFFDHYLKGLPPPKWMTEGIPARLKGIETGYGLDTSGKQP
jgi:dipeptidyl aminopeptidase/acylaminoacyl peptidase